MTTVKKPEDARSLQDVFDLAVTRVLQNRWPAYVGGDCVYRTSCDEAGRRSVCAVGALIPEHRYSPKIEGSSVAAVLDQRPEVLPENIRDIPGVVGFLIELQEAHDVPAQRWNHGVYTKAEFKREFLKRCRYIAKQYHLDPSVAAG